MRKALIALLLMAGIAHASTNEISVSTTLKVSKDATKITRQTGTILIQMAGNKFNSQVVSATTTNQFLTKGGVVTPGWAYMRNLSTNTAQSLSVTFDGGATTSIVLEAKEPALFRCAPDALITNWTVSASSGSVDFEFTVIED